MMNTTDGFVRNLFRNEKPAVSTVSFDDPDVWVCDLLNENSELAHEYIGYRLDRAESNDKRLSFLYDCRYCFKCALDELRFYKENPQFDMAPVCCGNPYYLSPDEGILIYENALNKVEHAICHYQDSEKLNCSASDSKNRSPNFTPHQWALIFHVFFKAMNIDISNGTQMNMSMLARFLHLVTGAECPEAFINSTYLDYLKNAPDFKRTSGKQTVQDLEAIRVHFERVGFYEALGIIDNLLVKYRKMK